jgi:hypothetical protein
LGEAHVRERDPPARRTVEREPEVHRVHHVGGVAARIDHLDLGAHVSERGEQVPPLPRRAVGQRLGLQVHERVDPVLHPEVVGPDHQVAPAPAELAGGELRHAYGSPLRLIV